MVTTVTNVHFTVVNTTLLLEIITITLNAQIRLVFSPNSLKFSRVENKKILYNGCFSRGWKANPRNEDIESPMYFELMLLKFIEGKDYFANNSFIIKTFSNPFLYSVKVTNSLPKNSQGMKKTTLNKVNVGKFNEN